MTMMDALTICGVVASMRHAGYLTFAAAVLGIAEAHYPGLRKAALRAGAGLAGVWVATMRSLTVSRCRRAPAETHMGSGC
jgi:hypothetical protein